MDETFVLISLVLVMLLGSFIAGSIPLFFTFSEDKLRKTTVFGAGLLVGTALAVIIPEGIRPLTSAPATVDGGDPLAAVGLSLIAGFVFMLCVDQLSQGKEGGAGGRGEGTATLGLVVHAAADGVALGAAATTNHHDVEMIVFLAIMLHKAPAAFGLVTFLLHEGVDRQRIRKHLLVFSLAAPIGTLVTYFGLAQGTKETLSSVNATGIAMLFSAGTFLYVATVHVLADLTGGAHSHQYKALPVGAADQPRAHSLRGCQLLCLVVGCFTPLLLTVGHHHHHHH